MAVVPGSYPSDRESTLPLPFSPGPSVTRKTRLGSFWEGTTDIEPSKHLLSTIQGSPTTEIPPAVADSSAVTSLSSSSSSRVSSSEVSHVPPATVPARLASDADADLGEDYFSSTHGPSSPPPPPKYLVPPPPAAPQRTQSLDPSSETIQTVPALPRRINLTRQTSSPLPHTAPPETGLRPGGTRAPQAELQQSRAVKEEAMFCELGYLAPPYPPDELERRRALYQFNLWRTGPDAHFDRIVHLTRLVFNTKMVLISLIDGNEQRRSSLAGISNTATTCARASSICAHTILQRGDEPMVVLDTHEDWRFARNPTVTGAPHVRFYAGAPLRTQDGFNVGTLAISDDVPHAEFSPRQRHTLKEFAAIAMREMELWRDKIQLRIRDRIQTSMEQFTRECLEIDTQTGHEPDAGLNASTFAMDRVYERAAKLVQKTLDVEGAIVMDVSHSEVVETTHAPGIVSVVVHSADAPGRLHRLAPDEGARLYDAFVRHPDGRICEGLVPAPLRPFIPQGIQYALSVPIFNIDKQPFAMICAYNFVEGGQRFLEGHELSYLRAIGVIILSAVLKRRMTLADKAKSLFISNISHELRTPLHGILAAAELLADTPLNHSQLSFLQTVQACGTSLVETVNHVLDFTKLSGNSKAGGVEHSIGPSRADLMLLVEEAVEGCWIGHRARTSALNDSVIGSLYSPPRQDRQGNLQHVEIIVEIGERTEGWMLKFEKGGIRRVLMNVFGNSLKFTTDGYVHVILRQLPSTPDMRPNQVKIELAVVDTGKGISQDFLKNQLFHPFSQENPLQTGTGLGLAIVNSIVQSKGVEGKVDVWSAESVGTEIKVTFNAEVVPKDEEASLLYVDEPLRLEEPCLVSLVGFDGKHRGVELLKRVLVHYVVDWWGCRLASDAESGHIVIVNEDTSPVTKALQCKDATRPFIILTTSRGDSHLMSTVNDYESIGGFCRVLYKPGGPSRLRAMLKLCLHALKIGKHSTPNISTLNGVGSPSSSPPIPLEVVSERVPTPGLVSRRYSEDKPAAGSLVPTRPPMGPRSITVHPAGSWNNMPIESDDSLDGHKRDGNGLRKRAHSNSNVQSPMSPTIAVGSGATLLKSSVGALGTRKTIRVLVVEDNNILRNLLVRWLQSKGYEFRDAVDGREGVRLYESDGNFDVVLLDMSMPVLDGVGATTEIRQLESSRPSVSPARILALTGMSSLEDKRRAFDAGVDGYLVKPIAFKTLTEMFARLGIS
ncbi:hypothetical protein K488DRAFT_49715 [Vararia minispora EC-137]|uniref:Uncharacterized protein n=1 Tax=Vararia minispora EC-137 TaxID=1314806 RepID=A0ACB8QLG9_9AGAM|nr:hypothetical protein K488DRAFT_49715 [Vararia minispora EC-137]